MRNEPAPRAPGMTEHTENAGLTEASMAGLLPRGAVTRHIAFVTDASSGQEVVLEFPLPMRRRAVVAAGKADLSILSVPIGVDEATVLANESAIQVMRQWVEAAAPASEPLIVWMTFQGAHVIWARGRCAVMAQPDRLEAVQRSLIEASFYDAELRDIEHAVGHAWPQLEADTPSAFEVEGASARTRNQLRQGLQQALLLRTRLVRVGPFVQGSFVHPPTLASQVSERLRERIRVTQRFEALESQLEVFDDVYGMCGQRVSDSVLARKGRVLEWTIIVLLATQLLLWFFELLTATGS